MVKLVQQYFSQSAKKFPEKVAVNFGNQNITFSKLEKISNRLARALKKSGVKRGDRVCFCLGKSINSIAAVLGILKADAVYVPLNPSFPKSRLKDVVKDAEPRLIIYDKETAGLVKGLKGVFNLDKEEKSILGQEDGAIKYKNKGSDLAYILYTSGSTGKPKGVMITHDNIINATEWAVQKLGITARDRMSQHPPLYFDLSTFDLYCAFKSGAELFLVKKELSLFPGQLMKFIEQKKLTVWNSVPSVIVLMAAAGLVKPGRLKSLKKIFFNGEAFPTKYLIEWMKCYPQKTFINMYGPTEATVQSTYYVIPKVPKDPTRLVPIGKACRNVEVFLVDGELYIAGRGVGKGYWGDKKKTKAAFVSWPGKGRVYKTGDLARRLADGNYEFIGRKDFQVKVMGNRIELGDIESALYSLSYIKEAGAVALGDEKTGGAKLAAFVALKKKKSSAQIKDDLAKLLPGYMIPQSIEVFKSLPKTGTGKIDRTKLKTSLE